MRLLCLLPLIYGVVRVMDTAWVVFPGPAEGNHLPTVTLMIALLAGAVLQYRASRDDSIARGADRWFALLVGLCAGTFVTVVLMPNLFGMRPSVSQGPAFVLFGMLFLGVAAGVTRYRLFELESWAFSILGYFGAVVLLDAALISFVAMERPAAFALSLLVVALVYLLCRDRLPRWLMAKRDIDREALFGRIVNVALARASERLAEWRRVLQDAFHPLQMRDGDGEGGTGKPVITTDGLSLEIPGLLGLSPVTLSHAHVARRLFNPKDRRLAAEIYAMLAHAIGSCNAHEKGAAEERLRIDRDMHDNIGAQLLSALYSTAPERKDTMIRKTVSDLRDIVNNAACGGKTLGELQADLRAEALERLSAADIRLDWRDDCTEEDPMLTPNTAHSLRSVLREIISNMIRHSGATATRRHFAIRDGIVHLDARDNGHGLQPGTVGNSTVGNSSGGNSSGFSNLEARLPALKGALALEDAGSGLAVRARFSLIGGAQP